MGKIEEDQNGLQMGVLKTVQPITVFQSLSLLVVI